MPESYLSLDIQDGVAVVTMSRAPVNALNREFVAEISEAAQQCESDRSCRAIVIASGLPKVFCAGADIRELDKSRGSPDGSFIRLGQGLMDRLEALAKPIIAAIRGVAVGGGCELAMACDLRVAGASAIFGQPEVNLGVLPGWGGSQRLPRLIGKTRALELMLTGDTISAEEALRLGLVNVVAPDEEVLGAAKELAGKLAAKSSTGMAGVKRAVQEGLSLSIAEGLQVEAKRFQEVAQAPDAGEGIAAFLEKRQPKFQSYSGPKTKP